MAEAGDFEDKDLPFYSRHTANVGLGYKVNQWSVNADMFAQSKQHSPGSGDTYQTDESADGKLGVIFQVIPLLPCVQPMTLVSNSTV